VNITTETVRQNNHYYVAPTPSNGVYHNIMIGRILRMYKRIIKKYHTEGPILLVRQGPKHLASLLTSNKIFEGDRQFKSYNIFRYKVQKKIYSVPARPTKIICINPERIKCGNFELKSKWGLGQIKSGDWDTVEKCTPVENDWVYRGLIQRFEEGRDWQDTVYVQHAVDKIESGEPAMGYKSITDFKNVRCNYVDDLFETIRTNGYRSNIQGKHDTPELGYKNSSMRYKHRLEPLVVINRNGDIYLRSGFHRFTIARILGIDSIPVNVLGRHKKWQMIRDRIYDSDRQSKLNVDITSYCGHPDLKDIEFYCQ